MEEIKKRKNVVSRLHKSYLSNQSMTGYIETDIDTVYLQLRKIIELVMFACVVANDSAGLTLNKTLKKGYEIKKIKNELKRFNSDFFPSPMAEGGIDENGIRKVDDLDPSDQEFLTEEELFKVYGKAGKFLHSQREYQYGSPEEKIKILNEGIDYINKLVVLLNHHWTKITNDTFFAVVMQDENDGKVHVARMARFDGGHT
ncbi:hypothetical protein [Thiohalophilus sp.]|uniref:hypothetical protein n=1 Tax=Thiohalophilus sp. TaxID=3028392 RepID=UPI002ACD9CDA|nr:hypothetical protein [Thiohalophilus sp.]MDZ7660914.1 hypothetical protein [Thiohalophilus sp.]